MSEKLVPKRQYTDEFKVEAIRLAESVGQNEAARRLGVPVATLCTGVDVAATPGTLAKSTAAK
jgi:transposase-like protein